jgi:hypothetical protein
MLVHDVFFVDKSGIIEHISKKIRTKNRFLCITKPRRFGKTSVLNMLGAYYGKAYDSKPLFDNLAVSKSKDYETHLNQYNIITLSFNNLSDIGNTYNDYIDFVKESIKRDVFAVYPELKAENFHSISSLLSATGDDYIFIMDEWDYIFSHNLYPENQGDFLEFLRDLLKDRPYVAFAYMTGVLPIKKYSTGSALNMFQEYTMLNDPIFEEYFGFTQDEVTMLCERQTKLTPDEISEWYNGYQTKGGELRIPNKELMIEFENALEDDDFGYVAELVKNSTEVLNATLKQSGEVIASYLHNIHNSELPILKYNDENSLSCVVTLAYLSARNKYKVEREEKSGKGFADFIFYPRRKNLPGIILELKADSTPEEAINQIKEKEYCEKLRKEHIGKILAVGISYNTKEKDHKCIVEEIN